MKNLSTPSLGEPCLALHTDNPHSCSWWDFFESSQYHIRGGGSSRDSLVGVVCQETVATPSSAQPMILTRLTKNSIPETSKRVITASPGGVGIHPPFPSGPCHSCLFICTFSRIICHYCTDGDRGIRYNSWTLPESHCLQPR